MQVISSCPKQGPNYTHHSMPKWHKFCRRISQKQTVIVNVSHGGIPTASNKAVSSGHNTSLHGLWRRFFPTGQGQPSNGGSILTV